MSDRGVTFPVAADGARDAVLGPLVERATRLVVECVGVGRLEAVVLTGSLARGEGSLLMGADKARLLGDVEFLVIWRSPFDWSEARRRMVELSDWATRELGRELQLDSIEYSPAGLAYLGRRMRPSMFAYDLLHHGKVVWGRGDILSRVRPFDPQQIPREDAVALILNRLVEQLADGEAAETSGDLEARAYGVAKMVLDLAGSALAFEAQHVSLYASRGRAFRALLDGASDLRTALQRSDCFQEALAWATQCKLGPTRDLLLGAESHWVRANLATWLECFLCWELGRRLGCPGGAFAEMLELYLREEPLRQRLKGWVKYYWHPLRPRGKLLGLRAGSLLFRASPQRLTYAAALCAHNGRLVGNREWEARAARLIPARMRHRDEDVVPEIVALWRWLVRNN